MKTAIFWDFDGTLAYGDHIWSNGILAAVRRVNPGTRITLEKIRAINDGGYPWSTPQIPWGILSPQDWWSRLALFFEELLHRLGEPRQVAREASVLVREFILNPSQYHLYEDTVFALKESLKRGYQNILLSNNYPELEEILCALGLRDSFSALAVSALVGYEKPRQELFRYAKELASKPERCIMVGDSIPADIRGGNAAGMFTILVHQGECPEAGRCCQTLAGIFAASGDISLYAELNQPDGTLSSKG